MLRIQKIVIGSDDTGDNPAKPAVTLEATELSDMIRIQADNNVVSIPIEHIGDVAVGLKELAKGRRAIIASRRPLSRRRDEDEDEDEL